MWGRGDTLSASGAKESHTARHSKLAEISMTESQMQTFVLSVRTAGGKFIDDREIRAVTASEAEETAQAYTVYEVLCAQEDGDREWEHVLAENAEQAKELALEREPAYVQVAMVAESGLDYVESVEPETAYLEGAA